MRIYDDNANEESAFLGNGITGSAPGSMSGIVLPTGKFEVVSRCLLTQYGSFDEGLGDFDLISITA